MCILRIYIVIYVYGTYNFHMLIALYVILIWQIICLQCGFTQNHSKCAIIL